MKHNNVLLKALALVFVFALAIGCMFSCKTKDAIETLETELDNLEAEVAELAGLASAIDKVEDALESKDAALEEEIAKLAAKLEGVGENELAELVKNAATKAELESALEQVKIAYTAKVEDLAAKVDKLGADLKEEVAALKKAFDDATDKIWDSVEVIELMIEEATESGIYYRDEVDAIYALGEEYLFRLLRAQSVAQVDALIAQLNDKIAAVPDLLEKYNKMIATAKFTGNAADDAELEQKVGEIYDLLMDAKDDKDANKAMGYPEFEADEYTFGLDPLQLEYEYFKQAWNQLGVIRNNAKTAFSAHNTLIAGNRILISELFNNKLDENNEVIWKDAPTAVTNIKGLRTAINTFQNAYLDNSKANEAFLKDGYITSDEFDSKVKEYNAAEDKDNYTVDFTKLVVFDNISKFWDLSTQTDKSTFTRYGGNKYYKTYKLAINILNTLETTKNDKNEDVYISYYSKLVYQENYCDNLKTAYEDFLKDCGKTIHSYQVLEEVINWGKGGSAPLFTQLKKYNTNLNNINSWMKNIAPDFEDANYKTSYQYENLAYCLGVNDKALGMGRYELLVKAVDYAQKMTMIFNNEIFENEKELDKEGNPTVYQLGAVKFETLDGEEVTLTIKQIAEIVATYKNTDVDKIYVLDEDLIMDVPAVVSVLEHVNKMAKMLIKDYAPTKDHNVQEMLGESDYKHFVDIQARFGELRTAYNKIQGIVADMKAAKGNVTFRDDSNLNNEKTNWKVQIEKILEDFEIEDAKNVAALTTDAYKLFDELVLEFKTLIDSFDVVVKRAIELLDLDTWAITLAKEIYAIQANLAGADDFNLEIAPSVIGDYENIGNLRDEFDNVVDAFNINLGDAEIDANVIKGDIDKIIEEFVEDEKYEYILSDFLKIKAVYDEINTWADEYLDADADIVDALDFIADFYVSADEDAADALEIITPDDGDLDFVIAFNSADYKAFMEVYTAFKAKYDAAAAKWNALQTQMLALINTVSIHNINEFKAALKDLNTYFNAEFAKLDTTPTDKNGIEVGTIGEKPAYTVKMNTEFGNMESVFKITVLDESDEFITGFEWLENNKDSDIVVNDGVITDKMLIKAFLNKMSASMINIDAAADAVKTIVEKYGMLEDITAIDAIDYNGDDVELAAEELKGLIDKYFESYCNCGNAKTCVTKDMRFEVTKIYYQAEYYNYAFYSYTKIASSIEDLEKANKDLDADIKVIVETAKAEDRALSDDEVKLIAKKNTEISENKDEINALKAVQSDIKNTVKSWDSVMNGLSADAYGSISGISANAKDAIDLVTKDI